MIACWLKRHVALFILVFAGCSKAPIPLIDQAELNYKQAEWDEALAKSEKLLAINPTEPRALMVRGRTLIALGKFDAAIGDLSQAAVLLPNDPEPLYHRSRAYRELGQRDRSLADLQAAKELDLNYKTAYAFQHIPDINGESAEEFTDATLEATADDADASASDDPVMSLADRARQSGEEAMRESLGLVDDPSLDEDEEVDIEVPSSVRNRVVDQKVDEQGIQEVITANRRLEKDARRRNKEFTKSLLPDNRPRKMNYDRLMKGLEWDLDEPPSSNDAEENDDVANSQPPAQRAPVTTAMPNQFIPPRYAAPWNAPSSTNPPANNGVSSLPRGYVGPMNNPSLPVPGTNSSTPYQLRANPIYNSTGNATKPTLSTSLPRGITPTRPQQGVGNTTSRRLPSMLPKVQPIER